MKNNQIFKKIVLFSTVCLLLITSLLILQNDAFAQMSLKSFPVKGNDVIYSQSIPFAGDFSINVEYSTMIEAHVPDSVAAGKSFEVIIIPNSGVLTASFLDNKKLEKTQVPLSLGIEKTLEIPESMIGEVFVLPKMTIVPKIQGPAHIIPESLSFDSENVGKFQIFTNENIGTYDSVTVQLDPIINLKNSGIINLSLVKIPIGEQISSISTAPKILIDIPLQKFVQTNLHLQLSDGDTPGSFKIKPNLTDENDQLIYLPSNSVEIFVNGIPQLKINPNEWSNDFLTPGKYNIQARFVETKDPQNKAITYSSSESIIQTITIEQTQRQVIPAKITCPPNQVLENNQCVPKESEKGFFDDIEGGCLIATAAYGSEMAPQVQLLREIRDGKVMSTESGASFMTGFNEFYYSFSPYVADYERQNPAFKELVKIGIIPMLSTLSIMSMADTEQEILGYGIGVILMNIGMYVAAPIYTIRKIYQYQKNHD